MVVSSAAGLIITVTVIHAHLDNRWYILKAPITKQIKPRAKGERDDGRRTHGDQKEEHTQEHSDGHTWTSGSNTHTEQHGTPLDGRGTGHNT